MARSAELAAQIADRLQSRYGRLALVGASVLVGLGLCGTDRDTHSMGGNESLLGALFLALGLLGTVFTLGDIAFLKHEQRRNERDV